MGVFAISERVTSTDLTSTHGRTRPRTGKHKNGLTIQANMDLPSFPLALPDRRTDIDRYAHRRTILKGDAGNCLDAGLEAGYVLSVPSQEVLRVAERRKWNVENWLYGGTAFEYQRARDMGMKSSIGMKLTGEAMNNPTGTPAKGLLEKP